MDDSNFNQLLSDKRERLLKQIEAIDLLLLETHKEPNNKPKPVQLSMIKSKTTRGQVALHINENPYPVTMTDLFKHFDVKDPEKSKFRLLIKELRDEKLIACVKYDENNMRMFYGNKKKLGQTDFLIEYKNEIMKEFTKPMIV